MRTQESWGNTNSLVFPFCQPKWNYAYGGGGSGPTLKINK